MKFQQTQQNNSLISSPEGRLDFDAAPEFEKEIADLIDRASMQNQGLIIDCSGLSYISSAGLRAFLVAARKAKTCDVNLLACALTPAVQEVFDVSGFSKLIPLRASVSEALARS
jgi:anti-anti-sigma factor